MCPRAPFTRGVASPRQRSCTYIVTRISRRCQGVLGGIVRLPEGRTRRYLTGRVDWGILSPSSGEVRARRGRRYVEGGQSRAASSMAEPLTLNQFVPGSNPGRLIGKGHHAWCCQNASSCRRRGRCVRAALLGRSPVRAGYKGSLEIVGFQDSWPDLWGSVGIGRRA